MDIKKVFEADEVSIKELFLVFWQKKNVVFILGIIFFILGLISVFTTPDSYEATSVIISESNGGQKQNPVGIPGYSGFSGLLGQNGVGETGKTADFSNPEMYPKIVSSDPFLQEILEKKFYFKSVGDSLTIYDFFVDYDNLNALQKLQNGILFIVKTPSRWLSPRKNRGDSTKTIHDGTDSESIIVRMSNAEKKVIEILRGRIEVSTDGVFINVRTEMPEGLLAAQFNEYIFNKLIEYATVLQTAKDERDLQTLEERTDKARSSFEGKQTDYANFQDQNKGVISVLAKVKEQQLKYDYEIAFNIYNSLAVQLENKKFEVGQNKPLFSVFSPIYVPNKPNSTSFRSIILYTFFGLFIGFALIFALLVKEVLRSE